MPTLSRRQFLACLGVGVVAARRAALSPTKVFFPQVHGAHQTGSVLQTRGWPANGVALEIGDIFTIAGAESAHPISGKPLGRLHRFVVTETARADRAGYAEIAIWPPMIVDGHYRTVIESPPNGALIHASRFAIENIDPDTDSRMKNHREATV